MSHFEEIVGPLLAVEGGAREHVQEPGGLSIYGISLVTFRKYHKNPTITKEDMRATLTSPEMAKPIYKQEFWDRFDGDFIESKLVVHAILDQAANRGVEGLRNLLAGCLNKHFSCSFELTVFNDQKQIEKYGTAFKVMYEKINSLDERHFFWRFVMDAEQSYVKMAFKKFYEGEVNLTEAQELIRIWLVRTSKLSKLLI